MRWGGVDIKACIDTSVPETGRVSFGVLSGVVDSDIGDSDSCSPARDTEEQFLYHHHSVFAVRRNIEYCDDGICQRITGEEERNDTGDDFERWESENH